MRFILRDIRQWKIRFELLRFGILTLVVVLFWVGIELFNTYSATTIPEDYSDDIRPLTPTLDLEMLEEIKGRLVIDEDFKIVRKVDEELIIEEESTKSTSSGTLK